MKYKFFVLDKENSVIIKSTKSIDTLYKTCGYRKSTDFKILKSWNDINIDKKIFSITLWGKNNGKSNNINNTSIIKNIQNDVVYGTVVFVFYLNSEIYKDIDMMLWDKFTERVSNYSYNTCSESDFTFDNDNEDDEEYEEEPKNTDEIAYDNNSKIIALGAELTYEPYYLSSGDED